MTLLFPAHKLIDSTMKALLLIIILLIGVGIVVQLSEERRQKASLEAGKESVQDPPAEMVEQAPPEA